MKITNPTDNFSRLCRRLRSFDSAVAQIAKASENSFYPGHSEQAYAVGAQKRMLK